MYAVLANVSNLIWQLTLIGGVEPSQCISVVFQQISARRICSAIRADDMWDSLLRSYDAIKMDISVE